MFSNFKLADGYVTALDLFSMNCQANLVALSGCQSGLGHIAESDDFLGLMRGFSLRRRSLSSDEPLECQRRINRVTHERVLQRVADGLHKGESSSESDANSSSHVSESILLGTLRAGWEDLSSTSFVLHSKTISVYVFRCFQIARMSQRR